MDREFASVQARDDILTLISQQAALSSDDISLFTGLPVFIVRTVVRDLFRQGLIERTGSARGCGRYCTAGQKEAIISVRLRTAEILGDRGHPIWAIHALLLLRRFQLPPNFQARFDELAETLTMKAMVTYFRNHRTKMVQLCMLTRYLIVSPREVRYLLAPLLASGILLHSQRGYYLSRGTGY